MDSAEEARLQREQLERYLRWQKEEGGIEGPTHIETMFSPEQQQRLAWIKEHCKGSVMELGCGYGFVLAFCGGQIGVDYNPHSILLAHILNPRKIFIEADIRKLPFPDGFVDTVVFADCLEHLPWNDVSIAIAEGLRVCREKILISTPNSDYGSRTSASFKHQFLLTQPKFEDLLNMLSSLKVNYVRNYFWVLIEAKKT